MVTAKFCKKKTFISLPKRTQNVWMFYAPFAPSENLHQNSFTNKLHQNLSYSCFMNEAHCFVVQDVLFDA